MKDPTLIELSEVAASIVAEMPDDVREALDNIVSGLARKLGESPEAWRGAAVMALEMMNGLIEGNELGVRDNTSRFMLIMLTRFVSLPWAAQALEDMKAKAES
jgi:hypothetical protein